MSENLERLTIPKRLKQNYMKNGVITNISTPK